MKRSAKPKMCFSRVFPAGVRTILAAFALWSVAATASAAPFKRDIRFKQPDGTAITIHGQGDELNAILTYNGYDVKVVRRNGKFAYAYAKCNEAATELVATDALAGIDNPPDGVVPGERNKISKERWKEIYKGNVERHEKIVGTQKAWQKTKAKRVQDVLKRSRGGLGTMTIKPITGNKYGLTILVDFIDDVESSIFPVREAEEMLNGENYTNFGNYSSVRSYYKDVSAGMVDYSNTVVGYVRMPQTKEHYNELEQNEAILQFFTDLFDVLNSLPATDPLIVKLKESYQNLTISDNGEDKPHVAAFNVLYAGMNGGVWAKGLWPCSGFITREIEIEGEDGKPKPAYEKVFFDLPGGGPKVGRFQICDIGIQPSIGTFCHENGHMLFNFPDFYDYDYDAEGGAGKFCLMASTFDRCPQQVNAYMKYVTGWTEPTYIGRDQEIEGAELYDATVSGYRGQNKVFVYENPKTRANPEVPGSATEYFIFENRQKSLRDADLPHGGIAIWHVDELGDRDNQSLKYNDNHQNYELTLMQADGRWDFQKGANDGDETDLWYEGNNAPYYMMQDGVFRDNTLPSSRWWNGSNSFLNVQHFSVTGATMRLNFEPSMILHSLNLLPKGRVGTYYNWRVPVSNFPSNYTIRLSGAGLPKGLKFVIAGDDEVYIRGYPEEAIKVKETMSLVSPLGGDVEQPAEFEILPAFTTPYSETFTSFSAFNAELGWFHSDVNVYDGVNITNDTLWTFTNGNGVTGRKGAPSYAHTAPQNLAFIPEDGVFNDDNVDKEDDIHMQKMIISPMFDCSQMRQVKLSFFLCKSAYNNSNGYLDQLRVYYRNTPQGEWKLIKEYTESIPSWQEQSVVLPVSNEDRSQLYFGFEATSYNGNGVHIDDVKVYDPVSEFEFAQTTLPDAAVNNAYDYTIEVRGGIEPFVWSVVGVLPPGITFDGGRLSGTCSVEGIYTFDVKVKDNGGNDKAAEISNTFTLIVDKPRVVLFAENFESPTGNIPSYWRQESVSDDGTNVWWKLSTGGSEGHGQYPALPHEGAYNALLFWSDIFTYNRPNHVTKLISPEIYFGENSTGISLTFWLCMRELLRGDGLYDQDTLKVYFKEKESDPWGEPLLTINSSVDTWTYQRVALPDAKSGYICFEGNALYGNGVMLDDIRVGVASEAPVIVTRNIDDGFASVPFESVFASVGGTGAVSWKVAPGSSLPGGMNLSAEGVFSGTPKSSGKYSFDVVASGEDGKSYTATLKWTVRPGTRYTDLVGTFDEGMDWQAWTFATNRIKGWVFTNGSFTSEELDNAPVPVGAYSGNTNACLFHDGISSIAKATMTTPMIDLSWTEDAKLKFAICKKNKSSTYKDTLQVAYRISYGAEPVVLTNITASIAEWTEVELKLPEVSETMFIDFIGTARCGYGIAIDDISFTAVNIKVDTPYEIWKEKWYGDKAYDDAADSDGDGLTTQEEFVFGSDPSIPDGNASRLIPILIDGDQAAVTFRQGKEAREYGVVWHLLWSTNLLENAWYEDGIEFVSESDENLWWQVVYKHEKSNIKETPRRFFKLSVEMP